MCTTAYIISSRPKTLVIKAAALTVIRTVGKRMEAICTGVLTENRSSESRCRSVESSVTAYLLIPKALDRIEHCRSKGQCADGY